MTNTTNTNQVDPIEGGSYDTWGDLLDANRQIVDGALGSTATLNVTTGTYVLSQDESNKAIQKIAGTLVGNVTIETLAGKSRFWQILNSTTGAFTVTIAVAGGVGTSVALAQGKWALVNTDGTDCRVLDMSSFQGNVAPNSVVTTSIADGQVTTAKLADAAVSTDKHADGSVTTPKLAANAATYGKIQMVSPNRVLGNLTNAPADVTEIKFLDEDSMASDDPAAIPSQQSAKAYVDNRLASKFTISTNAPSGGQDGDLWFRVLP